MAKTTQKATKAVQTFWKVKSGKCVFHNNSSKRMRWGKPRKIKAKRCRAPKGGGRKRRRSEFLWNFGGTSKFCHNVEVKGVPINYEIVIDIFEGHTLQRWEFDCRRPKAATKAAEKSNSNRNTSNNKSSNKQQN